MPPRFVERKREGGEAQGREIVDAAPGQQRAEQLRGWYRWQRKQQEGLEHAEAARHLADHAGDHGECEDAGERDERGRGLRRQQLPEYAGGHHHLDDGQQHLWQGDDGAGWTQRPVAGTQGALCKAGPAEIEHHPAEQQGADDLRPGVTQVQGRCAGCCGQQCGSSQHAQTQGRREAAEADHRGDLDRRQSLGAVDAITHGGAGERRQAEVVAEGIGDERGQHHPSRRDPAAEIAKGQSVVAGQQRVAQGGEGGGRGQPARGGGAQICDDLVQRMRRQHAMQHGCDEREGDEGGERGEPGPPTLAVRGRVRRLASGMQHQ